MVRKIETDFLGLIKQWAPVNNFYFVVNDKYKGVNADCEQIIQRLKDTYKLNESKILTAKDMENILFNLEDDQIYQIIGFLPDPSSLKNFDFSIVNKVVVHIMNLSIDVKKESNLIVPDFNEKIKFNALSETTAGYLNNGFIKVVYLNDYLSNNSDFAADSLRDKLNQVYIQEKLKYTGDELFWSIVNILSLNLGKYTKLQ